MALIAPVDDAGQIHSQIGSTGTTNKAGNNMDKDSFLQLLVAQMKYQDPLEPTSNTEYISQYATFSELEQMQNVSNNVNLQRASSLVGKNVYMTPTNEQTGEKGMVYGRVDYVQFENNKAYLAIKGSLYSIDDLDSVMDPAYEKADEMARDLVTRIAKLPAVADLTLANEKEVAELDKIYQGMDQYQKEFITREQADQLKEYVDKIADLKKTPDGDADPVKKFTEDLGKLPELDKLTLEQKTMVEALSKLMEGMTDKQKESITKEQKDKLQTYVDKIAELSK
ncbi:MAG: flagellar hook capping FlgD N-terminal domain-containing protein [Lachnospiraceae bacterium]